MVELIWYNNKNGAIVYKTCVKIVFLTGDCRFKYPAGKVLN